MVLQAFLLAGVIIALAALVEALVRRAGVELQSEIEIEEADDK